MEAEERGHHVHHVCAHTMFTADYFSTSLQKCISDLGYCVSVAVSRNCTDLQMKNTFALKPLDRLLCAELSYNHEPSAPQGGRGNAAFQPDM